MVNASPIAFFLVMNYYRDRLEEQEIIDSFGTIYKGKNVKNSDSRTFWFPISFFWRRAGFIIVTVYLFAHPVLQMSAHYALTIGMVAILVYDSRAFETLGQRLVEVGSEFTLLLSSILIAQFMDLRFGPN